MKCPYCGTKDDCPHLFAYIDRTFLSIDGGYVYSHFQKFDALIEKAKEEYLSRADDELVTFADPHISDLWFSTDDDPVEIDRDVLFDYLIDLFNVAGAEDYSFFDDDEDDDEEDDRPCYSSSMKTLYAEDCEKTLKSAFSLLEDRLKLVKITDAKN